MGREHGYKDLTNGSWQGVYVPKGAAPAVTQKLFKVALDTMKHPEVLKRMADGGVSVVVSQSPDDCARFNKVETERFAVLIKEANIPVE